MTALSGRARQRCGRAGSSPHLWRRTRVGSATIGVSVTNQHLRRSLVLWVAASATAWTALVAASLEWNLTNNRHVVEELSEAASRSPDPRDARYRDPAVLGRPAERIEFVVHGSAWGLGLVVLGAAALFLRKRQRERMLSEATLRQSEERFRAVVEQAGDGFELIDEDGQIVDVNRTSCEQLGYSREELLDLTIPHIDPGVTLELFVERFRGSLGRPPITFDAQHRRKDGSLFPVEVTTSTIRTGDRSYALSLVRDVSERKQAERQVERLTAHMASIFNSMPSMLVGIDRDGRVTQWNKQAETDTGIRADDALRQPVAAVLPEFAASIDSLRQDAPHAVPISARGVPVDRNGERRFFDLMLYPLAADSLAEVVVRIEDVTARTREQGLLLQVEKMTSLGGLAAGLAHEINNPLGIITQAVQNVEQRTSREIAANRAAAATAGTDIEAVLAYHETREIPAFLKDIREAAGRAAHIVTSMLEFSRTGDTVRAPADLAQLLDVSLLFAASDLELKKRYKFGAIDIVRQYATDVPPVPVARVEMEQVFLNLLTNAVHAVSTNPPERAPRIVLRLFREDEYAVVQIIDNGPGIETATQRRVFEPFFTTKPPGMGTGLGLSLAYTTVTLSHRGLIEVDSSPDQGACFTVRLPLGSADDGVSRPPATPRRRA